MKSYYTSRHEEAMKSYYTSRHAAHYNRTWKTFLQKTLDAASAAIDREELKLHTQRSQTPLHILDAACGTGLFLKRLVRLFPSAELYGIDASTDMLAQAHLNLAGYPNIHLQRVRLSGEGEADLPFPPAFFDVITCTNVLHYLQKPAAVLNSFREMLSAQGQLVVEDYVLRGLPFLWKRVEWAIRVYDPEHHALFSPQEGQDLCHQVDLPVVMAQTFPIDLLCQGWVIRAIRP